MQQQHSEGRGPPPQHHKLTAISIIIFLVFFFILLEGELENYLGGTQGKSDSFLETDNTQRYLPAQNNNYNLTSSY